MEQYGDDFDVRTGQDCIHHGNYHVELETQIGCGIERLKTILNSLGYALEDFGGCGLTYSSIKDPDLRIDVDELDPCRSTTRLILHSERQTLHGVAEAAQYLEAVYQQILTTACFAQRLGRRTE